MNIETIRAANLPREVLVAELEAAQQEVVRLRETATQLRELRKTICRMYRGGHEIPTSLWRAMQDWPEYNEHPD